MTASVPAALPRAACAPAAPARTARRLLIISDRGHDVVRQVPGMDQQCPGHLADGQPQGGQCVLAEAPCATFIVAEAAAEGPAEVLRVPAVALPRPQPRAQFLIAVEHGPVHQPFRDLAGRVDDEREVTGRPDAMDPALVVPAVVDAGRTEARPYRQRRYRVTGFVPGGLHGRRPGRPEAGKAAAVVALPDPCVVHDGLVVVADDPAQLGLDPGQGTSLRRLHLVSHPTRKPGLGVRGVGYHAGTLRAHPRTRRAGAASSRAAARPPGGFLGQFEVGLRKIATNG